MEKYFEILDKICKENIDITKLYILSCISAETEELEWEEMEYAYDCWIEADTDLDLARLAGIVSENWEEIKNDEITDEEIIEMCITY